MQGVEQYGELLHATLTELAPGGKPDPVIALLTPGVYNSAYYEHMFLAREIGAELAEGRDLAVRNGMVYMRTTDGLRQVDVIYRGWTTTFSIRWCSAQTPILACAG